MGDRLVPCACCRRHVRCGEGPCPFCGAAVDEREVPRAMPSSRLGRAATFAFGAALAAASTAGCADSHGRRDAAAGGDAGNDAGTDAGAIAPPYGVPPEDAGWVPLYGAAPPD